MENKSFIIGVIILAIIVIGGFILFYPKALEIRSLEISTDKTEYSLGETIELTVINDLDRPVYTHPCGLENWPHAFNVMKKNEAGWDYYWMWEMVDCMPYNNVNEFTNSINPGQVIIQIPTGSLGGFTETGEYRLELSFKANCVNSSIDSCERLKSNSIEFKIK